MTRSAARPGFTLLEVVVAMSIGVLLLGALYMSLNVLMHQMRSGREIIEHTAVARALLTRISSDIRAQLAPVDPRIVSAEAIQAAATGDTTSDSASTGSSSSTSGTSSSSTADSSSKSTSTSSPSSSGSTSSSDSSSDASASADTSGAALFNLGVQGDSTILHLYISQSPKDADKNPTSTLSDLRRVSYWLAGTAEAPLGLARYEVKLATSSDGLSTQVPENGSPFVISKQVSDVTFEYFDGTAWLPAWDGASLMADGKTPQGPPVAVAVTLTIKSPALRPGVQRQSTLRHVVFLAPSNGADMSLGGVMP